MATSQEHLTFADLLLSSHRRLELPASMPFGGLPTSGLRRPLRITLPAITRRWRSGQDFPRWIVLGDRFTAANLHPALARPGQKETVEISPSSGHCRARDRVAPAGRLKWSAP
ncbi:hypothetical protein ebB11 [Aromatoleum aromaticum EbN1]|uniref:Uncharacterized protein n=1 Tax=Aromatoleum aromaticum (strain DSM 19018 / LMG 30748 / EbN1) TaxID=76114 RepID=Q5P8K7_AROAE|nr:hypothetical protein ebB11 [Aromatoleum aromaticum EbN1]